MIAMGTSEPTEKNSGRSNVCVGVVVAERLYAGLLVDGKLSGSLHSFPEVDKAQDPEDDNSLLEFHTDALVAAICDLTLQRRGRAPR